ncbi:hypothetical protein H1164_03730 [Thermoactinomyces daqus]|uniref:Uncharacterized protein n=1 Tax=Thermoactinomyces daqus TaxID=1329516 RepID=A0A7W2AGV1_9BACL|nr:hypothetical protein [Thermoactinomyces daqus]MBA4542011.1 hypothetical protein [Thermoactinomyces daqus]
MNSEELALLVTHISQSAGMSRDRIKREYLGTIKRLIRAEFRADDIYVMVLALVENNKARDKWLAKQTKPGAMKRVKRLLRRLGGV